ncbi:GrpB family protein [Paenibacillus odorifer]|uniref:GrpB family protein n=1 Tax=Paenibacillus odorifer TaxID=189426 RepID=UPI003532354C
MHAFQYDKIQKIGRHLSFRDYLRQNPEICKKYGELISKLADQYPTDIDGYGDGKDEFVRKIEEEALKWHWTIH